MIRKSGNQFYEKIMLKQTATGNKQTRDATRAGNWEVGGVP
jgi:hypothetical protein